MLRISLPPRQRYKNGVCGHPLFILLTSTRKTMTGCARQRHQSCVAVSTIWCHYSKTPWGPCKTSNTNVGAEKGFIKHKTEFVWCSEDHFCPAYTNTQFGCPTGSSLASDLSEETVGNVYLNWNAYCVAKPGFFLQNVYANINHFLQWTADETSSVFYTAHACQENGMQQGMPSCVCPRSLTIMKWMVLSLHTHTHTHTHTRTLFLAFSLFLSLSLSLFLIHTNTHTLTHTHFLSLSPSEKYTRYTVVF